MGDRFALDTFFLRIADAIRDPAFVQFLTETWWLIFIIPATLLLKKYLHKLDSQ